VPEKKRAGALCYAARREYDFRKPPRRVVQTMFLESNTTVESGGLTTSAPAD
jgi:hypothetical protein